MKAGCVCAPRLPTTGFFPLKKEKNKKQKRKERNTGVESFGSYIFGFLQRRDGVGAALGLGRGRGQAEGWGRGQVG